MSWWNLISQTVKNLIYKTTSHFERDDSRTATTSRAKISTLDIDQFTWSWASFLQEKGLRLCMVFSVLNARVQIYHILTYLIYGRSRRILYVVNVLVPSIFIFCFRIVSIFLVYGVLFWFFPSTLFRNMLCPLWKQTIQDNV